MFEQELVWKEDPDPDGAQSCIQWTLPWLPSAPDLLLRDPENERCFWFDYSTNKIHLLTLPKDISEDEWKSEVKTAFTINQGQDFPLLQLNSRECRTRYKFETNISFINTKQTRDKT